MLAKGRADHKQHSKNIIRTITVLDSKNIMKNSFDNNNIGEPHDSASAHSKTKNNLSKHKYDKNFFPVT